jgi:hypothetical protein
MQTVCTVYSRCVATADPICMLYIYMQNICMHYSVRNHYMFVTRTKAMSTGINSDYKEMRTKWNSDLISSYCAQTILRIISNLFPCKLKDHSGQTDGRVLLKPPCTVLNTMYVYGPCFYYKKQKEKKDSLKTKTIGCEQGTVLEGSSWSSRQGGIWRCFKKIQAGKYCSWDCGCPNHSPALFSFLTLWYFLYTLLLWPNLVGRPY